MKYIRLAVCLLGIVASVNAIPPIQSTPKRPTLHKPIPAKIARAEESACVTWAGGLRVCKVKEPDARDGKFIVQKSGKTWGSWEAQISVYSDTKSYEVMEIDLDGNGTNEIIVAEFTAQSNGIGFKYYTLFILPDPRTNGFHPPLSFQVEDYGAYGNFVKEINSKETLILVTNWESREVSGKEDSYAMYLTGRWFRYRNGKLQPAFDKPILSRRLLKAFEQARANTLEDNVHPYSWLNHPKTEKLKTDPLAEGVEVSAQNGVIEKFARIEKKRGEDDDRVTVLQQIVVRFDSGQTKTFLIHPDGDEETKGKDVLEITHIGFLPARFSLPAGVSIFSIYEKLEGKQVRLVTYKGTSDDSKPITMWLTEK